MCIRDRSKLAEVTLFAALTDSELDRMLDESSSLDLVRGDVLFKEDEDADALFVVESGRVAIGNRSVDGRESIVALMESGDLFGEMSLFDGTGRSADARALEPSQVLSVPFGPLRAILDERPALLWEVVKMLSGRLRHICLLYTSLKGLGRDPLVEALSRMQPLAATTVTRDALSQDGFKALRSEVAKRTSIEEVPDAEDLSRFSTRRILTISMIGGAAYFLVPQLASAGNLWDETQSANWWWAAVALLCSAVSYVGSGLALVGGVPNRVPILQAVLALSLIHI